jgi:hypothetical protein
MENENDSCVERVKHLQKGDDNHLEIIKYLEKENNISSVREFFFYVYFVIIMVFNFNFNSL